MMDFVLEVDVAAGSKWYYYWYVTTETLPSCPTLGRDGGVSCGRDGQPIMPGRSFLQKQMRADHENMR